MFSFKDKNSTFASTPKDRDPPKADKFPPHGKGGQVRCTPTNYGEFKFKNDIQFQHTRFCPPGESRRPLHNPGQTDCPRPDKYATAFSEKPGPV